MGEAGGDGLELGGVTGDEGNARPSRVEGDGDGGTDAPAGTGDDGRPTVERRHRATPIRRW